MQSLKTQRPDASAFERRFSRERLTVLVVDGGADLGRQVGARLAREAGDGAEVVRVTSLAKGLLALAERKIDLVLLDLFLPDSSGLETAVMMVRGGRAVPIIVVATPGAEELCFESLRFGVLAMVAKERIGERSLLPLFRWAIDRHAHLQGFEQRNREKALRDAHSLCRPVGLEEAAA